MQTLYVTIYTKCGKTECFKLPKFKELTFKVGSDINVDTKDIHQKWIRTTKYYLVVESMIDEPLVCIDVRQIKSIKLGTDLFDLPINFTNRRK